MKQWIGYGSSQIDFEIPDNAVVDVLRPNPVEPAADQVERIVHALDNPIGTSLESLLDESKRVCIIVDDVSRPTPAELILSVLLPRLHSLGVKKENIYFVLALGSHRRMTQEEVDSKLGAANAAEYAVYQSSFADPNELLDLGLSETGVPIVVYKKVMDSDVRIGIGNIVPHNTLGWSGGSKILFPGVTSEETVCQFHMRAMRRSDVPIFGNVDNPVRCDVEQWTEKIGLHFIINTILTNGAKIFDVVAGHHVQAHRQGVELAKKVYSVPSPRGADIVIVDSHPSDCDFWQGTKGFNPSNLIVKDGGAVILVSPFYEGVGPHAEYPVLLGRDDADTVLETIMREGVAAAKGMDPLAVAVGALISRMRQRFDMYVYSDGVDDALLNTAQIHRTWNLTQTVTELTEKLNHPAHIVIIRFGAEVVPDFS